MKIVHLSICHDPVAVNTARPRETTAKPHPVQSSFASVIGWRYATLPVEQVVHGKTQ
jgi:hypothetical protein